MNLAETLAASAAEVGMKKVQGKTQGDLVDEQEKPTLGGLGDILKASMAEVPKAPQASEVAVAKVGKVKPRKPARKAPIVGEDFETEELHTWSFSTLMNFERCKHFVRMDKINKVPQPSHPNADRGSLIHDELELYVRAEVDELPEDPKTKFDYFRAGLQELREEFEAGNVELEENWGIRKDWSPCEWSDAELWGRMKLDFFHRQDLTSCRIGDYKTGRKHGNELKHKEQAVTYALAAMHRYPELEFFRIEIWYIDQGETAVFEFSRSMLNVLLPLYHDRAFQVTSEVAFPPMPSVFNCQYCSYGCNKSKAGRQYGNGECDFDVFRTGDAE